MKRNLIETLMGAVVLVIAAFFVITTYQSSGIKKDYGYKVSASFNDIGGISIGSDVRIAGVKVGTVISEKLDTSSYKAVVGFGLQSDVRVSTDTSALIVSDGLLGGKYIKLDPGQEQEMLKDGGVIDYTQSSVNLEQLIGKMAFGGASGDSAKPAPTAAAAKPAAAVEPVKTETIISTDKIAKTPAKPVGTAAPIETPKAEIDLKKSHPSNSSTE